MASIWRDIRFGVQTLRRSPGFTAVAVVTLALGIGLNSAVFSIVSGTLFNSLPWEDPATIVAFLERHQRNPEDQRGISTAKYPEWREQTSSFTDLGAAYNWGLNLTDGGRLDFVEGAIVTPNCFPTLGIRPMLGRGFLESDVAADAEDVVILTEGLWKRRYGADPEIVGKQIEIDGEPATVVGVQGSAQWFPWPWIQILSPLRPEPDELSRTDHRLNVYGRLRPGVELAQAQAEMDVVASRLAQQYP